MILRLSVFFIFLSINLFAITVIVAKEAINYEEKITIDKIAILNVKEIKKSCEPVTLAQIQSEEYLSAHYINKGTIICKRNIKKYENEAIVFNFGDLQIEKKGKIIYENDEFIRFKNLDGTIEKIYKDGRLK